MSEPKWTPAQRAAIEDRGGALLVSAAAGSGKTAVLTERAVRLITDPEHPVDADRLLIVTFTNAAAAELRARIGQALLKRSQAEPGNGALRRQRILLQRAPICTIDAFCLDLLRKHFQALDIPPDFSPADPGSVELLRASALSETLENAYRDPDFCAFADLYGKGRTDRAAGETILHVYDFLRALPDYDKKLDEFLAPWQEENGFAATCWHDLLLAEAARSARAAGELFRAALADCPGDREQELADAEEKKTPSAREKAKNAVLEKYTDAQERLDKAAALLGRVEQLAVAGEWTPLYDLLTPYVLGMEELPGLKGMKKRLNGEHKKVIRTRADEGAALFAQILELIPCSEEEAEADRRAAEPRLRALFAAVRDFDARFSAKKRDRKLLEFSDFEHQALRLLRDPDGTPTALCGVIRQNYAAVMVDEYQDTNALQDALYRCLASPAGDDLFLVGDLKQSIYRFRQADPSIFREKLEARYGKEGARERIYATTDARKGALKGLADDKGYEEFVVPDNIGGRYSVLTAVGLLPIAVAGIDIDALMAGAADMMRECALADMNANPAWQYAGARYELYRTGKKIELLAAYEPCFRFMSEWWKQLYGESEGKENKGLFPASVEFTADLHSMGQYIQEGERHLFETVVRFGPSQNENPVPYDEGNGDGLNFLAGKSMDFIRQQAMDGTLLAHVEGGVPNVTLRTGSVNEQTLGGLIYFFEYACGLSGYLLDVNPFDQPGVEAYKKNMFALLGKPGYEDLRQTLLGKLEK